MRAFLFDLDDTLFDHRHSTRVALSAARACLPPLAALPFDALEAAHAGVLEEVHREVIAGRIDVDAARVARFARLVEMHGGRASREEVEAGARAYRAAYLGARRAVAGASELLRVLRPHGAIAVVSNNVVAEQVAKIAVCGLRDDIDALVVSEEAGVAKPDPEIFRIALERVGCAPGQALMIGDSWNADIMGARAAGIRAIWFNPLRRPCPDAACLTAELHAWEPVEAVLARVLAC
ncbi:MAG TPA: HAD family hydrolase [Vicinamibacterales bacterium]|nr:HAD family hydrolase [Vicinamibacterales bacterium]